MLFLLRTVLLLLLLYLFLIAPNVLHRKISRKALFPCDYAHRGLHDQAAGIPENSLAAFRKGAAMGYGIELDVHLTADRQLIVIHDHRTERMCGVNKKVKDLSLGEIRQLRLNETEESVPTLDEALAVIDGKVPLMLELKSPPEDMRNTDIAALVNDRMRAYHGPYCVESFNPLILRWYKKHAPQVLRGQLACDQRKMKENGKYNSFVNFLCSNLLLNFLSRPDFVSYCHKTDRNLSYRMMRDVFRPMLAAWTVRSAEEYRRLSASYDALIFESFTPQNDKKGE